MIIFKDITFRANNCIVSSSPFYSSRMHSSTSFAMFAFLLPQHLDHPPSNPFVVFIVHQSIIVLEEVQGRLADLKILFHILEGSGLYHRELVHDFKSCCSTHQILRVDISTCLDEQLHHLPPPSDGPPGAQASLARLEVLGWLCAHLRVASTLHGASGTRPARARVEHVGGAADRASACARVP